MRRTRKRELERDERHEYVERKADGVHSEITLKRQRKSWSKSEKLRYTVRDKKRERG